MFLAAQVSSWKAGRNGLASQGRDDGPRVTIPMNPAWIETGYPVSQDRRKSLNDFIEELKFVCIDCVVCFVSCFA